MAGTGLNPMTDLARELLSGNARALSRAISVVERGGDNAPALMGAVDRHTGRAYTVGVTGPPGRERAPWSEVNPTAAGTRTDRGDRGGRPDESVSAAGHCWETESDAAAFP